MRRIGLALVMVLTLAQLVWAATNPARQYEEQRDSTPPADGVWHVYDRNGNLLREEHYKTYRLSGEMKTFYPSGAVKEITIYDDGHKQGPVKTFYENGSIQAEATYQHNNYDGPSRKYYPTGELESEFTYDNGNLVGDKRIYFKSGALKQVLVYKEGILDGTALTYSETGQVLAEELYRNGVLSSRKQYSGDDLSSLSVLVKAPTSVAPTEGQPKLPPSKSMTTPRRDPEAK